MLPDLPLAAWRPTKDTLHLYVQIVGKVRLAVAAPHNHWWHVPLYLDVAGLTTRRLQRRGVTFQISFDFNEHVLRVRAAGGRSEVFALQDGLSVAAFDRELHTALGRLGVDVELREHPYGLPITTPFAEDVEHASYDPEHVRRYWQILNWADGVFDEFSGWYSGKTSPVHLFWHSLDLAVTRFSGRRAALPADMDPVNREAYSHEVISFGFWPGDDSVGEPAFYSYTAPAPDGLTDRPLRPDAARWTELPSGQIAVLPYEAVRGASDPRRALLSFLQSGYDAGSISAGWDREALASSFAPSPAQLRDSLA
jgi:hypothetical protein